jgi:hypothetical protein
MRLSTFRYDFRSVPLGGSDKLMTIIELNMPPLEIETKVITYCYYLFHFPGLLIVLAGL